MTETTDLPDGYYQVPPGKIVNAVTWLEMRSPPAQLLGEPLRLISATDIEACRDLFKTIGMPWLWSRAYNLAPTDPLPADTYFALDDDGLIVGIVEFAARASRNIEIYCFGLKPDATGAGLGRRMMAAALGLAWTAADRVWLHTCSFDHPAALRFYVSCGFTPYATGFEILDDPRLVGAVARTAAPQVPLILVQA
jgi:GNAT superfamily N-acetyltransferase